MVPHIQNKFAVLSTIIPAKMILHSLAVGREGVTRRAGKFGSCKEHSWDYEYDGELEKEANSPEMENLRKECGVLTREEADRAVGETFSDLAVPRFGNVKNLLRHLHELRRNHVLPKSHQRFYFSNSRVRWIGVC
jgi:hypothetical protein